MSAIVRRHPRLAQLGLLLALLVSARRVGWAQSGVAASAEEEARIVVPPPSPRVSTVLITNRAGNVELVGHDAASIIVVVKKRASSPAALAEATVQIVPLGDGRLRVSVRAPQTVSVDLRVSVPRATRFVAELADGRFAARHVDVGGEVAAERGGIDISNVAGEIAAYSTSGAQQYTTVFGSLRAQSLTGDVAIEALRGASLIAAAHRGRITARRVRVTTLSLTTTYGDIWLEADAVLGGQLRTISRHGNITVKLPKGWQQGFVHAQGKALWVNGVERPEGVADWALPGAAEASAKATVFELRSQLGVIRFVSL